MHTFHCFSAWNCFDFVSVSVSVSFSDSDSVFDSASVSLFLSLAHSYRNCSEYLRDMAVSRFHRIHYWNDLTSRLNLICKWPSSFIVVSKQKQTSKISFSVEIFAMKRAMCQTRIVIMIACWQNSAETRHAEPLTCILDVTFGHRVITQFSHDQSPAISIKM